MCLNHSTVTSTDSFNTLKLHNTLEFLYRPSVSAVRRTREVYLHIVGQLRGHQVVEFLFAQGAGGSVLPSIVLELGDDGGDGGFHDGLC